MRGEPRVVEYKGERVTVTDLAARCGISAKLLHVRIFQLGWTVENAASRPVAEQQRRGGRTARGVLRPVPKLKRRPDDGGAYVRWKMRGVNHVRRLGRHGSAEANEAYRRFASDWVAGKYEERAAVPQASGGVHVAALVDWWLAHVRKTYVKNGKPTSVVGAAETVGAALNTAFGTLLAAEFKPQHMREVREVWIQAGRSRATINRYSWLITALFKWAGSYSHVPAAVYDALRLVEMLKPGRTAAADPERKRPATDAQVEATLPHLCPREPARGAKIAAMIRVQRLAGMRPGEICAMSAAEIDTAADVWRYEVGKSNKNRHRGKRQVYYLGPKAVAILKPFLVGAPTSGPLFGETTQSYARAILFASVKAGAKWTPHQLRHALATAVAERFRTLEHAAAAIGDTKAVASAVYIHVDPQEQAKIEVARAMG